MIALLFMSGSSSSGAGGRGWRARARACVLVCACACARMCVLTCSTLYYPEDRPISPLGHVAIKEGGDFLSSSAHMDHPRLHRRGAGGGGGGGGLVWHSPSRRLADLVAWTCEDGRQQRTGCGGSLVAAGEGGGVAGLAQDHRTGEIIVWEWKHTVTRI